MKNWIFALIVLFTAIGRAQAQIPVTDGASLVQQMQQVQAWITQLDQMKQQLQQQQALASSMNGVRGMGQLLNNPALKNALPADWQKVYSSIQNGGYQGLSGSAKAIRDANAIFDCGTLAPSLATMCQRQAVKSAQDKAFAQNAYDSAQMRLDNIQGLMQQIDQTTDPKSIAELQGRMQAEQAMIQNEQTKLIMFRMMADSEEKIIQQQAREQSMKDMTLPSKARSGSLQPVQF